MSELWGRAMQKVESGDARVFSELFGELAKQAAKLDAATSELTFGFSEPDEDTDDYFVPEIVLRIRKKGA